MRKKQGRVVGRHNDIIKISEDPNAQQCVSFKASVNVKIHYNAVYFLSYMDI